MKAKTAHIPVMSFADVEARKHVSLSSLRMVSTVSFLASRLSMKLLLMLVVESFERFV
jgi:hypothetical protein